MFAEPVMAYAHHGVVEAWRRCRPVARGAGHKGQSGWRMNAGWGHLESRGGRQGCQRRTVLRPLVMDLVHGF